MSEPTTPTPTSSPARAALVAEYQAAMRDPDYLNPRAQDGTWSGHRRAVYRVNTLAAQLYGTAPVRDAGTDPMPPAAPLSLSREAVGQIVKADAVTTAWIADPDHPVNQRHHPEHKQKVEEYQKMLAMARNKTAVPPREMADAIFSAARQGRRETR